MRMIDRNLEAIILYGAFDGIVQLTGLSKIRSTKLQTLVPMCMIDEKKSGEQTGLGFLVAMWAVRRAGKAQSGHVDCHLRLCTVHAVSKNAQHVRQMCCASLHMQYKDSNSVELLEHREGLRIFDAVWSKSSRESYRAKVFTRRSVREITVKANSGKNHVALEHHM